MQREQILYYAIKYQGEYQKIRQAISAEEKWNELEYHGNYLTILDQEYPREFLMLKNPPFLLFYEGKIDLLKNRKCAIVGSRNPVSYALEMTKQITSELKTEYTIVSGLAKGIDALAHSSACLSGNTIAIVGNGLNIFYPLVNQLLQTQLKQQQLILSEYPDNVKPLKHHFPMRNRLIAALSEFIVVTQANLSSGTFITVNVALELNKDIFVLPYGIDCMEGIGCNYLIQQGASIILDCKNFYK